MNTFDSDWQRQLEGLGRQYWKAWSDLAQGRAGDGPKGPNWHEGLELWARLTAPRNRDAEATLERFSEQAQRYLELLGKLSGKASAEDIARAWREALQGHGNPMLDALASFTGEGAQSFQQLAENAMSAIAPFTSQARALMDLPAFGLAREHQERWQALAKAQAEYAEQLSRYQQLMTTASEKAFAQFEHKLAERSEPGRQVDSIRGLFDLWIDAAEEAYAEVAMSSEFREVYGGLVDAQTQVRAAIQAEVEKLTGALGMPTRSEADGSHRKVQELRRELRGLRERFDALEADRGVERARSSAKDRVAKAAAKSPPRKPVVDRPKKRAGTSEPRVAAPKARKSAKAAKAAKKSNAAKARKAARRGSARGGAKGGRA